MLANGLLIPNRRYPRLTDADVERLPGTVNFIADDVDAAAWSPTRLAKDGYVTEWREDLLGLTCLVPKGRLTGADIMVELR